MLECLAKSNHVLTQWEENLEDRPKAITKAVASHANGWPHNSVEGDQYTDGESASHASWCADGKRVFAALVATTATTG